MTEQHVQRTFLALLTHQAQTRLYTEYHDLLLDCIMKLTGSREDAEDLLHDMYMRAFASLLLIPPTANLGGWLYRIARNLVVDKQRRATVVNEHAMALEDATLYRASPHVLETAEAVEAVTLIRAALDEMPAASRERLMHFNGDRRSLEEIAESLDIPREIFMQRLKRARAQFRAAYAHVSV